MIVIVGSATVLVALAEGSGAVNGREPVMRGRIHVSSDNP